MNLCSRDLLREPVVAECLLWKEVPRVDKAVTAVAKWLPRNA